MAISRPFPVLAAALLSACAYAADEPSAAGLAAPSLSAEQSQIERGQAFVEAECSGCHAVLPGTTPPNPQATTFEAVANDMGFTPETLREFFLDGHDVPYAMTILLEEDEADIATAYIMSLRRPHS